MDLLLSESFAAICSPKCGNSNCSLTCLCTMQVLSVLELVDLVCAWMQRNKCCTCGTLTVLRQVSVSQTPITMAKSQSYANVVSVVFTSAVNFCF